jgi:hypothetical protein
MIFASNVLEFDSEPGMGLGAVKLARSQESRPRSWGYNEELEICSKLVGVIAGALKSEHSSPTLTSLPTTI